MKRWYLLIGCLLLVFLLAGCTKDEVEETLPSETEEAVLPISVMTGSYTASAFDEYSNTMLIEAESPHLTLCNGDETRFSALQSVLEDRTAQYLEQMEDTVDTEQDVAFEMHESTPDFFQPFRHKTNAYVCRADTVVFSLLYDLASYTGGAHGNRLLVGESYNSKTGELLSLKDVVKDLEGFYQAVSEQFSLYWEDIELFDDISISEYLKQYYDSISWTLGYNGITVYFNSYEIAPYAYGTQIVTVTFEEYPALFYDEFCQIPKAYGVQVLKDTPFYYDVTGDGRADELLFSAADEGNGDLGDYYIYINGTHFAFSEAFYDISASFVQLENGRSFLYVQCFGENGYPVLSVYELNDSTRLMGSVNVSPHTIYAQDDDDCTQTLVLTDPTAFAMDELIHVAGSVMGTKTYFANEYGVPVTEDERYLLDENWQRELKTRISISAELFDEKTIQSGEDVSISPGVDLLYYATDGKHAIYVRSKDRKTYRIPLTMGEYGIPGVENVAMEAAFDGIFYAG